ncbi:MAG TPA: hypothetical protein PKY83_00855 [Bacteroidales bacterium]|jgi:hypothetical protein|nr:hypothetical protein [Bacteroidales bacterium]
MKKITVIMLALLLTAFACNNNPKGNEPKVSFGIYETAMLRDLPDSAFAGQPGLCNLIPGTDSLSPIVAYVPIDSTFTIDTPVEQEVKFLRTTYPVDPEKQYYGIVAVREQPTMTNIDLKTTKPDKDAVKITFTKEGSKKWAEMTRINIGKTVAISIDDQVYTLPKIMAEIGVGRAMIIVENEETAVRLSAALNGE